MNIEGGLPKIGAWQFTDLRKEGGGLDKKEGRGVFEGGLIPRCTLFKNSQMLTKVYSEFSTEFYENL